MTKDQSLCIYGAYYKLAREGNPYTEWYTIHSLSLNALVLIPLLHGVFFFFGSLLSGSSLSLIHSLACCILAFHLPSSKFPFGHLFSQTLGEDGRRSYFAMNSTL